MSSLQLFVLTSILISSAIVIAADVDINIDAASISALPPSSTSPPSLVHQDHPSSLSLFAPILAKFGFRKLADAAESDSPSTTTLAAAWRGPATIFAPTDFALLTCPSCSVPLLLQEHIVPGLYPFDNLRRFAFGTKIETLAPSRCVTITSTYLQNKDESNIKVFVVGVEVNRPDLYNDGNVVLHGIQGFVSHLSPTSCIIERMSSLSFPPPSPIPGFFIMRQMLKDVTLRLRISGFSVLALALREKYAELLDLQAMTVFALDDASIFTGGHSYIADLRLHVVPDRRLMASDLENMSVGTALTTMEWGQKLVVTTAAGGGPLAPMRINYDKITRLDLISNLRIAVHGLSLPFQHVNQTDVVDLAQIKQCGWDAAGSEVAGKDGTCETVASMPGISWTAEIGDHHGL